MGYLSPAQKIPGSIFPTDAKDARVKRGELSVDIETTGQYEDIRASRALAIIHAFECLMASKNFDVLNDIRALQINDSLGSKIRAALGAEVVDAICKSAHSRAQIVMTDYAKGLVEDVLQFDQDADEGFSLNTSKYQGHFLKVAATKPELVKEIMPKLRNLRDLNRDEFRRFRNSISLTTEGYSFQFKGFLGAFDLAARKRILEPAEELLIIGFDPETLDERLEL